MVSVVTADGTTVVTCKSTHLTSFAVLVNAADGVNDVRLFNVSFILVSCSVYHGLNTVLIYVLHLLLFQLSDAELKALMAVSYIGCAISLACLSFAIIYYITIRYTYTACKDKCEHHGSI